MATRVGVSTGSGAEWGWCGSIATRCLRSRPIAVLLWQGQPMAADHPYQRVLVILQGERGRNAAVQPIGAAPGGRHPPPAWPNNGAAVLLGGWDAHPWF